MKDGMSPEDFAERIAEALNKSKKGKKEITTRQELIDTTEEALNQHIDDEEISLGDAVAIAWLEAVKKTDTGKDMTSVEELKEFFDFMTEEITSLVDKWHIYKKLGNVFNFGRKCGCKNKREGKEAGSDRFIKVDSEIISDFLRKMGLSD